MKLRLEGFLGAGTLFASLGTTLAADIRYTCEDGQELTVAFTTPEGGPGSAHLTFSGSQEVILPQALSADGGRYADADTQFWIKGRQATLTRAGASTTCSTSACRTGECPEQ